MPKTEQPAGDPIVLTVGTIIAGQHYPAGKPLPYVNEADVPRTLRPFIASGPPEPPEELQGSVFCMVSGFSQTTVEQPSKLDGAGYERSSMPPTPGPTNEPSPSP
ncbi:MAG: hypothetical protein WBL40_10375 [Terrimicrobiaceae bacterium]